MSDFIFSEKAQLFATSGATTSLYQVLLGRDPENSHVIEESKNQRIESLFRSFVKSAEFSEFIVVPLREGTRLRHELTAPGPNPAQRDWVASLLVLAQPQHHALSRANSWREFFIVLLSLVDNVGLDSSSVETVIASPTTSSADRPGVATMVSIALEEIMAIEMRLNRLRTLLRDYLDESQQFKR